jgi:uncharacterized protein YabN with tetrapyrrole methylase and pyrophosphatase domain
MARGPPGGVPRRRKGRHQVAPGRAAVTGSLTVVGTGIQLAVHLTPIARAAIERADELLYLVRDPVTRWWITRLNANNRSLSELYVPGRARAEAYRAMVDEILTSVRAGRTVCAAFYGHPGIFVEPGHAAVRQAREEGFRASIQPGISAEDCLFADLGLDPADNGCQSFEATTFLIHEYRIERSATLILWQIGVIGQLAAGPASPDGMRALVERLADDYPLEHETIIYEASPYPFIEPLVRRVPLSDLAGAEVPTLATLVIPPNGKARLNLELLDRLGLPRS